jgi:hypothetical protein
MASIAVNIPIILNAGFPCEAAPFAPAPAEALLAPVFVPALDAVDAALATLSPAAAPDFSAILLMHETSTGWTAYASFDRHVLNKSSLGFTNFTLELEGPTRLPRRNLTVRVELKIRIEYSSLS